MLKERLYNEHQKLIKKYKSGSENIDKIQNEITQLEETREKEKVRLEKNKLNELERLKARRNECNLKIESLNKKGNESEYVKEYRNKLNNACEKLQNIDADYTKILNQELDSVKKQHNVNTIYSELKNKQKNKALPGAIEDRLNESLDNVINRNNLNDKSDIISISKKIKPLESLINYAPSWMEIVFKKIFPLAVSAILLIIWLIVGGTSDVAGDAVAIVMN